MGAFAWTVVFPVYVAWTLWNWVMARLGVARAAFFMYLVPIIGGGASWLLLGEGFGLLKVAGAALTLVGLAFARRSATPERGASGALAAHPTGGGFPGEPGRAAVGPVIGAEAMATLPEV